MRVIQVLEKENGNEVNVSLSDEQLRFVTEVGLGLLLSAGAITINKSEEQTATMDIDEELVKGAMH